MMYINRFAWTKNEMEALNEFVTKELEAYDTMKEINKDKNEVLARALNEIKTGLKKTNEYYFGNAKCSQYNIANRSPTEND